MLFHCQCFVQDVAFVASHMPIATLYTPHSHNIPTAAADDGDEHDVADKGGLRIDPS